MSIRKSKILAAINEIFKTEFKAENEKDFLKICLTTVENLTGSKFGFIGELNQENGFDTIGISNPGWNACKMPSSNATMKINIMELRGIWGRILKDEKSYIINDPSSQSDSVGTPAGHPKIASFLGVPLKQEGKTFGLIALANKNAGYTQDDLEAVEAVSYAIVVALMHKRTEIKLKDSEESLRNLLEQLIASLEFKAKFFASMSHDLRTPLNAIIGFSDLLIEGASGNLNNEQLDYLKDIKASADVLLELIDSILDYSKIEAGKFELSICKFNLFSIIEELKAIVKPLHLKKGLNFYLEGINEQSYLNADPLRFKQVLYNLVDNAIKFTEKGSITLKGIERMDHWEFQIKDTGIGIAKEDFEVVFREFMRIEKDIIKPVSGSGLGLALTKRLIQLHGGNIWFESEVGKGTTFYFTIPKHLRDLE